MGSEGQGLQVVYANREITKEMEAEFLKVVEAVSKLLAPGPDTVTHRIGNFDLYAVRINHNTFDVPVIAEMLGRQEKLWQVKKTLR